MDSAGLVHTFNFILLGAFALKIVILAFVTGVILLIGRMIIGSSFKNPIVLNAVRKIFTYTVIIVAVCILLTNIFGIDVSTLMAVLGVGTIALGFAMQSLVKDIITGLFLLVEGQFTIGDRVLIKGIEGKVTDIGLRTTRIQSEDGSVTTIPNNEITVVTNYGR